MCSVCISYIEFRTRDVKRDKWKTLARVPRIPSGQSPESRERDERAVVTFVDACVIIMQLKQLVASLRNVPFVIASHAVNYDHDKGERRHLRT